MPGRSLPVRQPCASRHPTCLAADGDGFFTKELGQLDGPQRNLVLAIHQLVEMGCLLVDRALEKVAPV
ncbi:DUF6124 family protein [Pseudomonas pergaminensis]|uniref:DUF6124 family protein n=1 Tax=Pseudomonas pergaminensis TaxID=2853159 RepID=A0ABW8R2X3_9PSED